MIGWTELSIFVQIFCTLAIFSFLYKDNPIYKFAEHLFVGVATGWWIVLQYRDTILPNLAEPLMAGLTNSGEAPPRWYFLVLPLLLGVLLFVRLVSQKHAYLSRWSMAVIVGTYSGLAIRGFGAGDLFNQVQSNIIPFFSATGLEMIRNDFGFRAILELLRNPVLIIGTLTVLVYFFFSLPHKGAVGGTATVGIWFLMVSFGASYGNTVMARISLFIGRSQFLLTDETGELKHWPITVAFTILIVAALVLWERSRTGDEPTANG